MGDADGAAAVFRFLQRQQREHRPRHVPRIAADLILVFHPAVLRLVPPACEFHRIVGVTRRIPVAQTAVAPVTVVSQRHQHRVADARGVLRIAAAHQRHRGNGIVVEERRVVQRAVFRLRKTRQEDWSGRRLCDGAAQHVASRRRGLRSTAHRGERKQGRRETLHYANARSRSAMRSSASSTPHDNRTNASEMPSTLR